MTGARLLRKNRSQTGVLPPVLRALPGWMLALQLLCAPPAAASVFEHPATAAELTRMLAPAVAPLTGAQTMRGRYRQTKHLAELPRPLLAEGDFLFVRDLGVAWRTERPFASELLITRGALVHRSGGGEQRVEATQQPAVRMVALIFFAVFSLDFDALAELFTLYGTQHADGRWTLGLRPVQAAGTVVEIEVDGRVQVERVLLREAGGDRTLIELGDAAVDTAPPGPADRTRFALP